ncbi:20624_t:CDS:2 [Gigaspora margarita]|uniref:20624_t:CDS:1 n=1 Tax=Gigaspora margarita TaxID=4874 RepID=A0ABN7VXB3_GIGMA|nr:20624_t:CDS:2 [Gigaspora margarita]
MLYHCPERSGEFAGETSKIETKIKTFNMFPVPPIETVYAWRQGDLMAFIQRVERLHPEDRNFHIIEGLNLTPVRLLKLTDERIEALVTERHIQTTQGDIIESARDELAIDNLLMHQPTLNLFHVQVMERLHDDIAFGVDLIENNGYGNLISFLKAELKKQVMLKTPRAASIAAAAAIARQDGGSNPENASHERSQRRDPAIKEELCEVNKLIIFQQRQSGAGYCLRNHICKYIMRAKGNLSESTLSKHIASDMEELQIAKFPVEPEEREFIKYCQEQTMFRHQDSKLRSRQINCK